MDADFNELRTVTIIFDRVNKNTIVYILKNRKPNICSPISRKNLMRPSLSIMLNIYL